MIYIISKIISFFIDPIIWIIAFIILGRLLRHRLWKRRCYIYAFITLMIFSNTWLLNQIWDQYQWQPVSMEQVPPTEAGILLGGLSGFDEQLNMGFFGPSSDRFIQTNRLFQKDKIKSILITGGNIKFFREQTFSEAEFLGNNLVDAGVPRDRIHLETKAKNTLENARLSKLMLDSLQIRGSFTIITSAIHMPRAVKIFKKAGLEVIPFPSNYLVTKDDTRFKLSHLAPSTTTLLNWSIILREWMGLAQLALVG